MPQSTYRSSPAHRRLFRSSQSTRDHCRDRHSVIATRTEAASLPLSSEERVGVRSFPSPLSSQEGWGEVPLASPSFQEGARGRFSGLHPCPIRSHGSHLSHGSHSLRLGSDLPSDPSSARAGFAIPPGTESRHLPSPLADRAAMLSAAEVNRPDPSNSMGLAADWRGRC